MNFTYYNKAITGMLTILPANEVKFEDGIDNYNFSAAKSLKLKKALGYNTTRIVNKDTCVSDLCIYGLNYLFDKKENHLELDKLIVRKD